MTPPNRFWPFYDDQEVEIYDNPFWDLPGRTRQPRKKKVSAERGRAANADKPVASHSFGKFGLAFTSFSCAVWRWLWADSSRIH